MNYELELELWNSMICSSCGSVMIVLCLFVYVMHYAVLFFVSLFFVNCYQSLS